LRGVLYRGSRREITWDRVEDFLGKKERSRWRKGFFYTRSRRKMLGWVGRMDHAAVGVFRQRKEDHYGKEDTYSTCT